MDLAAPTLKTCLMNRQLRWPGKTEAVTMADIEDSALKVKLGSEKGGIRVERIKNDGLS